MAQGGQEADAHNEHAFAFDASGIDFRLRTGRGPVHRKGKGDQDHHGADQVLAAGISGADADNGTKYVSGVDHSTPLFFVGATTR